MADPSPELAPDGPEPQEPQQGATPDPEPTPDPPEGAGRYSEAYVRQLRRESQSYRQKLGEAEERLQELDDQGKSESQRLSERLTEAEKRATDAELRLIRYEVAAEQGLDMQAAAFLTGSTREEVELRAEELSKLLAEKGRPPTGTFDGGARTPAPDAHTPEEAHNALLLDALGRGRQPRR